MSLTKLIDDLQENSANLRTAMQGADVAYIEDAVDAFCASLEAVRAVDTWPANPEMRAKFEALKPELEQSRALALLADTLVRVKNLTTRSEDQAMHCTYGDGSEIPFEDMEKVRDAIWKNMVAFRWKQGDVVAIDNFAVSHGRLPYRGPRTITVCWATTTPSIETTRTR